MTEHMKVKPPEHWMAAGTFSGEITVWIHKVVDIRVLRSLATLDNGEKWIHVSVSREERLPSWEELTKVKNEFIGIDIEAYQVLPAKADYVNDHPFCLHLWAPVDGKRRVANLHDIANEEAI